MSDQDPKFEKYKRLQNRFLSDLKTGDYDPAFKNIRLETFFDKYSEPFMRKHMDLSDDQIKRYKDEFIAKHGAGPDEGQKKKSLDPYERIRFGKTKGRGPSTA